MADWYDHVNAYTLGSGSLNWMAWILEALDVLCKVSSGRMNTKEV